MDDAAVPPPITTLRGHGYRLELPNSQELPNS
jgi:hypothetical protein